MSNGLPLTPVGFIVRPHDAGLDVEGELRFEGSAGQHDLPLLSVAQDIATAGGLKPAHHEALRDELVAYIHRHAVCHPLDPLLRAKREIDADPRPALYVVGAYQDVTNGNRGGAAYVYAYNPDADAWDRQDALLAAPAGSEDHNYEYFGHAVAIHGTTIVVSSIGNEDADDPDNRQGSLYVFEQGGGSSWDRVAHLTNYGYTPGQYIHFPDALAISDSVIATGADNHNSPGTVDGSGAVHLFSKVDGTWGPVPTTIIGEETDSGDRFGWSVAVHDNTLLVGSARDAGLGDETGSATVFFQQDGVWTESLRLRSTESSVTTGQHLESAVSISDDLLVVGAKGYDDYRGAVYGFEYEPPGVDLSSEDSCSAGLVGYWPFDEKSGERSEDVSGYDNDATLSNPAARTSGVAGNAVKLLDQNASVTMADHECYRFTDYTIEFWFKGSESRDAVLFDKTGDVGALFITLEDGYVVHTTYDSIRREELRVASRVYVADGAWHHVAAVYEGLAGEVRLTIDGSDTEFERDDRDNPVFEADGPIFIGASGIDQSAGIDELRIYNIALPKDEIQEHSEMP